MITHHDLDTLVDVARERSPYYRELYAGLPARPRFVDLPVVEPEAFWAANTVRDNRILTGPLHDGIVFRSGGTTGNPKFSVFNRIEWESLVSIFGAALDAGGLRDGERVANLFYVGELYSSFLFIMRSLEQARADTLHFPLSGRASAAAIEQAIEDFGITTLAGTPSTLVSLASHYAQAGRQAPSVTRLLFAGESMYADQREILGDAFPCARANSIGYATVDAGLLAYTDPGCAPDEHRMFSPYAVVEIIDEATGQAITAPDVQGRVVVTNLTRLLMPIIRYPAGDLACWTEPEGTPDRRFRLIGRSDEGARIGPATLYSEDVRRVLGQFRSATGASEFQILVEHVEQLDRLTLRIAASALPAEPATRALLAERIIQALHRERVMLTELIDEDLIHPLAIEWVAPGDLEMNQRSGKLKRVVDRRHGRH